VGEYYTRLGHPAHVDSQKAACKQRSQCVDESFKGSHTYDIAANLPVTAQIMAVTVHVGTLAYMYMYSPSTPQAAQLKHIHG